MAGIAGILDGRSPAGLWGAGILGVALRGLSHPGRREDPDDVGRQQLFSCRSGFELAVEQQIELLFQSVADIHTYIRTYAHTYIRTYVRTVRRSIIVGGPTRPNRRPLRLNATPTPY